MTLVVLDPRTGTYATIAIPVRASLPRPAPIRTQPAPR